MGTGEVGSDPRPIIWLASYPKSGNTWLRAFLQAYRNNGHVDINQMSISADDLPNYFYKSLSTKPLKDLSSWEMLAYRNAVLLHMVDACYKPGSPFFVKTHNVCAFVEGILLIPPQLTHSAVYIVRDPRDVAVSYADHCGISLDKSIYWLTTEQTRSYKDMEELPLFHFMSRWDVHVNSWADSHDFPCGVVRYEDLLTKPFESFSKVLNFLQWPLDGDRLQRAIDATTFQSLEQQEKAAGFKERKKGEKFFRSGRAGTWKNALTTQQASYLEKEFGTTMKRFNYL